jgi:acyl-coenzyme A synthetase/AMP-(fatty) acid ligase
LEAAVIGVPDEDVGERIKGFVVLREGYCPSAQDIMTFANDRLAGYKSLHFLEFLAVIPKTASGKLWRSKLKKLQMAQE